MSELRTLLLFNEKAEKLDGLSFTKFFRENSLGYDFDAESSGETTPIFRGPSDESTDAFVLTLRFFVQNNEPTSIQNMGALYESLAVSDLLKSQFAEARAALNSFLEASRIQRFGEPISNHHLFRVFMYGGLAHASIEKKAEFDLWASNGSHFPVMRMLFHDVLAQILSFIFWCHEHNLLAIAELAEPGESS